MVWKSSLPTEHLIVRFDVHELLNNSRRATPAPHSLHMLYSGVVNIELLRLQCDFLREKYIMCVCA